MTDLARTELADYTVHKTNAARRRLARRYAAERRFRALGLAAVLAAMLALVVLLSTVVSTALPAFVLNYASLPLVLSGENIDRENPGASNFDAIVRDAIDKALPFAQTRAERRAARGLISDGAGILLREAVLDDPALVGGTARIALPLSDTVDLYLKGLVTGKEPVAITGPASPSGTTGEIAIGIGGESTARIRADANAPETKGELGAENASYLLYLNGGIVKLTGVTDAGVTGEALVPLRSQAPAAAGEWRLVRLSLGEAARKISDREIAYVDVLEAEGLVEARPNWIFFTRGASREPEMAGILGAVAGSFFTLIVTLALSFPVGVGAAVYLEEFAPKNRWTTMIEVNINNLAAVPSIVFGLLGLAVFLNFFGLPRSTPLVGGMVLALMTLPIIIIASRAALRAVPPSIREAALGIGASRLQMVFHHVLPLAMPGVMTGTIIGMAHALGETAPLLMIGMVAFIIDVPGGVLEPATLLPVQIFMWADFPEAAFQQKTSAAIIVLLAFLIVMNALAVLLRKRFERRW
jgi:phosphate transport system permease protein